MKFQRIIFATAICGTLLLAACNKDKKNIDTIQSQVNQLKKELPEKIGATYTLTDVNYNPDSRQLRYYYDVDTTMLSYEKFVRNRNVVKERTLSSLLSGNVDNPDLLKFNSAIIDSESSVIYQYNFNNGKEAIISVSNQELRDNMNS